MGKHLKFAAGVGVVLAMIFLLAVIVEPFVGELKSQSILVPVNAAGVVIMAIAAAFEGTRLPRVRAEVIEGIIHANPFEHWWHGPAPA